MVYLLPILIGALLAWQGPINAELTRHVASVAAASALSLMVSVTLVLVYAGVVRMPLGFSNIGNAPFWALIGGLSGAMFVVGGVYLVPVMGAGTFILAVVLGQAFGAALADHFGWFNLDVRALDAKRLAGLVLMLVGLWLVKSK